MKENLEMTEDMVTVNLSGLMAEFTKEDGKPASSMVKEHLLVKMETKRLENGKTEKESSGCKIKIQLYYALILSIGCSNIINFHFV